MLLSLTALTHGVEDPNAALFEGNQIIQTIKGQKTQGKKGKSKEPGTRMPSGGVLRVTKIQ